MASLPTPYRQIRASYTSTNIILYQAYNTEIATAAIKTQRLDASPKFRTSRMTWIKPSWAWMLYRSGYSYKDPGQERILALTLKTDAFVQLLRKGVVAPGHGQKTLSGQNNTNRDTSGECANVRVQWDPERTMRLEKLNYRSIQIGIPGSLVAELVAATDSIEDVTDRARELKKILDEDADIRTEDLVTMGLVPEERALEIDEDLYTILDMGEL